ncbi:MAG: hypothetical protein IPO83_00240 [Chitinophagaceae bacterium]|nr:hypothetical protein [Chitinophagaceae bacterium]
MYSSSKYSRISVIALMIIFYLSSSLIAQQPIFKHYTTGEGLPSQVVYCTTQDSKGYLWFGTDAGASRYDGHTFENFNIQDGLSDNEILNIHKDSKGRLWFFTLNGKLSYFLNDTFFNAEKDSRLELSANKFEAVSFMEDADSNIWIGSRRSQLLYFGNNGKSQLFNLDTLLFHPANSLNNWVFTYTPSKDKVWIMIGFHTSILFEYKNNIFEAYPDQSVIEPLSNQFYMQNTNLNTAFFNGSSGICIIENGKSKTIIPRLSIPHYEKDNRFFVDRNMDIWTTSSDNMIYHFKHVDSRFVFDHSYFLDANIGGVFVDSENNTWFSTTTNAVYKLSPNSNYLKIFPGNFNNTDNSIECVKLDNTGRVWFSSSKGNLYQLNKDSLKKYTITPEGNGPGIRNFVTDINGNVFCITAEGLFSLNKNSTARYQFISVPARNNGKSYDFRAAKYLKIDRKGRLFFTSSSGLLQLNSENNYNYVNYVAFNSLLAHRIYSLYFDALNNMWFENFEELCCYNNKEVISYPLLDKEFLSQITSIEGVSDSVLAIATYGSGIKFFKNGKVINRFSQKQGLAGNLCRQIFVEQDTVYAATNQGFTYFIYSNNTISDVHTFSINEGMPSNDVRYIAAGDGRIYIATSSGLCVMNKRILTHQKTIKAPQTYFKSINVNGNNQNDTSVLASYYDDIIVNFTAITFDQPDKIVYQYNLTGKENGWIETKNTTAILSSLTPGNYIFSLRAKKYDSDWSNPIHFQLNIEPPYWQRWWFRAIFISILATAAYYLIKYITGRNYRIKLREVKAQQALAEERNRISSDMHDDLGADLSNILMLTRISSESNKKDPLKTKQLSEIEQFTTRVIGKVDEIIWALNPNQDSLQDLVAYIKDYCGQFLDHQFLKGKITIPHPVPDKNITAAFRRNIFLVIKEGMNNIIKHSGATTFSLELKFKDTQAEITLQDDGKGFLDNDKLERGNGLMNMQKRIRQLNGEIDVRSVPGNGTVLKLRVPIN